MVKILQKWILVFTSTIVAVSILSFIVALDSSNTVQKKKVLMLVNTYVNLTRKGLFVDYLDREKKLHDALQVADSAVAKRYQASKTFLSNIADSKKNGFISLPNLKRFYQPNLKSIDALSTLETQLVSPKYETIRIVDTTRYLGLLFDESQIIESMVRCLDSLNKPVQIRVLDEINRFRLVEMFKDTTTEYRKESRSKKVIPKEDSYRKDDDLSLEDDTVKRYMVSNILLSDSSLEFLLDEHISGLYMGDPSQYNIVDRGLSKRIQIPAKITVVQTKQSLLDICGYPQLQSDFQEIKNLLIPYSELTVLETSEFLKNNLTSRFSDVNVIGLSVSRSIFPFVSLLVTLFSVGSILAIGLNDRKRFKEVFRQSINDDDPLAFFLKPKISRLILWIGFPIVVGVSSYFVFITSSRMNLYLIVLMTILSTTAGVISFRLSLGNTTKA